MVRRGDRHAIEARSTTDVIENLLRTDISDVNERTKKARFSWLDGSGLAGRQRLLRATTDAICGAPMGGRA